MHFCERIRKGEEGMDTNILLDSGTNELEILVFKLGENSYGINVAKIREIINYTEVTPVPNSHPSIEGLFMPRDTMITAIDLKNCLQKGSSDPSGLFIITNFNKLDIAFHVDQVVGIHRVSWTDIIKPGAAVSTSEDGVATGIVKIDGELIIILDFEKIVTDISPETGLKISEVDELGHRDRNNIPVLVVEDSPLLNKLIVDCLHKAGYENLLHVENGQAAWSIIKECIDQGSLNEHVQCVITDIEMPLMDGHHLTKLIKTTNESKDIPVVIFSSLINDEMRIKGEQLGANAQLTKPEIGNLIQVVDSLVLKK